MSLFKLPDLGEGLPDAEIAEWHVKEGDTVDLDQIIVSMETAKAVVDVPSPQEGIIQKLYGKKGDIIITGAPLVEFQNNKAEVKEDAGSVVGNLHSSNEVTEDNFIIGGVNERSTSTLKATPKVKIKANALNIDLNTVLGTGPGNRITLEDLDKAAHPLAKGFEPIKGVRRHMVKTMIASHQEVVPVTIFDDANLANWDNNQDITVRLIQAISSAAKEEPALNAWYDGYNNAIKQFDKVQLGLATDTPDGLFVPVIKDACCLTSSALRSEINRYKKSVADRSVASESLSGATFTLSNFGKFAGRYASPIIVPPSVAILAVGRLRQAAVNDKGVVSIKPVLPLSLSFDHRAITGGEATRFLSLLLKSLEQ